MMGLLSRDTSREVEEIQFALLRAMPVWRKLELVSEMADTVRAIKLASLRQQFPDATEAELKRRLADFTLGPELALKVYGPLT